MLLKAYLKPIDMAISVLYQVLRLLRALKVRISLLDFMQ